MTQAQEEKILSLYQSGMSVRDISKTEGIFPMSKSSVHRVIKRAEAEAKQEEMEESDEDQESAAPTKESHREVDTGFPWLEVIIAGSPIAVFAIWFIFFREKK